MKQVVKTSRVGITESNSFSEKTTDFDLYLLSEDHRLKLHIARRASKKEAEEYDVSLAPELGVKFTTYNPKISLRTRMRRR